MLSKETLHKLYVEEKRSLAKIAQLHNVSTPTISNWMAAHGISKRSISQALQGQKHSAKRNLEKSIRQKGRAGKKLNAHTKQLISMAKSGSKHHMYGKHHSTETKAKMREAAIGRKMSPEASKKISEAKRKLFAGDPKNHPLYGVKRPDISGENHPNWNGGITPLYKAVRETRCYKEWRQKCFERDNYTCRFCDQRGGELCVDHINAYSSIIVDHDLKTVEEAKQCEALWESSNGRTLCVSCHRKTDTYGRPAKKSA